MTFQELAMKVHPDFNPGCAESLERMKELNKFRNNPTMINKLATRWGS